MTNVSKLSGGWVLAVALAMLSCGPKAGYFAATAPEAATATNSVRFVEQDNDVFEFMVRNLTDQQQTLFRDQIYLVAGSIKLHRESGGLASSYELPPAGGHDVKVKFDLGRIEGVQSFDISFEEAIVTGGKSVGGPLVHFTKR